MNNYKKAKNDLVEARAMIREALTAQGLEVWVVTRLELADNATSRALESLTRGGVQ
jgi:hypothetical protein